MQKIKRNKENRGKVLLREYRESIQISQTQLAHMVGVNPRTISAYEMGSRNPSIKVALKIARIFSLKVDDIFPIKD